MEQDPLANRRDRVLRLVQRRELRLQAVFGKGHLGESQLKLLKVGSATGGRVSRELSLRETTM